MNFFTHLLMGVFLGTFFVEQPVLFLAVVAGSIFPDLDAAWVHRKTLHFPVYYLAAAVPVAVAAFLAPITVLQAAALFLTTAAVHSTMDAYGGPRYRGPGADAYTDQGVYNHLRDEWMPPRNWYQTGSAGDLVLTMLFAAVTAATFPLVAAALAAGSAGYVVFSQHRVSQFVRVKIQSVPVLRRLHSP